jgi:dolichol-phosphate mannosyltransferase
MRSVLMRLASADLRRVETGPARAGTSLLELAVVIPTLDERNNIAPLLAGLRKALDGIAHEVIFVDDGSTDGTPELIAEIGRDDRTVRLIRRYGRRGLSSAVTEGALATNAPIIAVIDADGQHDEMILPNLFEAVASGIADIAVGTRYGARGSIGDLDSRRSRISRVATKVAAMITGTRLSDPMSGFFVVRQSCLFAALPRRIVELPYRFRTRRAGTSKLDSAVALQFLAMLIDNRIGHLVPIRLMKFLTVGALGVVVHLAVLKLLLWQAGARFNTAQIGAVIAAIAFNFFLNNAFTYRDRRLHGSAIIRGLVSFYLVCGLGALANVGVANLVYAAERLWWVAGVAGATIGALWNYTATSFLTWKRH